MDFFLNRTHDRSPLHFFRLSIILPMQLTVLLLSLLAGQDLLVARAYPIGDADLSSLSIYKRMGPIREPFFQRRPSYPPQAEPKKEGREYYSDQAKKHMDTAKLMVSAQARLSNELHKGIVGGPAEMARDLGKESGAAAKEIFSKKKDSKDHKDRGKLALKAAGNGAGAAVMGLGSAAMVPVTAAMHTMNLAFTPLLAGPPALIAGGYKTREAISKWCEGGLCRQGVKKSKAKQERDKGGESEGSLTPPHLNKESDQEN
jgi:hypothetical protein